MLRGDGLEALVKYVTNLTGNCCEIFYWAGEVVLSARLLSSDLQQVRIEFSVQDTGIGIASERTRAIFEGFTRWKFLPPAVMVVQGWGLRLVTSLVRLMGGELCVDSTPNLGSRFYFVLEFQRASDT